MATPRERLEAFLTWRGWRHPQLASACGCKPAFVSHVLLGRKRPGLDIAHAIERVTGEARDDGARWDDGPIRTEEWVTETADAAKPDAA